MQTKNILIGLVVLALLGFGAWSFMESKEVGGTDDAPVVTTPTAAVPEVPLSPTSGVTVSPVSPTTVTTSSKEFTMNSWMETVDGKMSAHFSMKEMVVKKGDKVKINITNTAGTHDFKIDAYGISVDTPLNEQTVVEFTADKVGDFEFYCSKYNHRSIGQTGTLRVTE